MSDFLLRPDLPPARRYRVEEHPECPPLEAMDLSPSQRMTLLLLVLRLRHMAGDCAADEEGIRVLTLPATVVLRDDSELAPIAVYFRMSDGEDVAQILEIELLTSDDVWVSENDDVDTIVAEALSVIATRRL